MFKTSPKILSHISSTKEGILVTPEYLVGDDGSSLFKRFCPHRRYPIDSIGNVIKNKIVCNLHGYEWNLNGAPTNNNIKLTCDKVSTGKSGLIFKNFIEPNHKWVNDLADENNLFLSHCYTGVSKGSWLWMMEIQADLLHIRLGPNTVHPELSSITNLNDSLLESEEGWALQTCSTGWWLCIFPYTFIEYSKGCLAINYTVPDNLNSEFGFTWMTQFYFDPTVGKEKRLEFEKYFQNVLLEDIAAIENYKHKYYPLKKSNNPLEKHVVEFGHWVIKNLKQ